MGNPVMGDGIYKGSVWLEVFGFGDYLQVMLDTAPAAL